MAISEKLLGLLNDKSIVTDKAFISGEWVSSSDSGKTFEVLNPSTGEVVAILPDMGRMETERAIDSAYRIQKKWRQETAKHRSSILRNLYDLILANLEDLATILTMEMGKPMDEARGEIVYGAGYIDWYAEEAKRIYGDTIPSDHVDKRLLVIRQPIGVVAAITPWNFPHAMLARKLAPALAAGCSLVSKPAAETPLSALSIAILAERAGLPAGLFSVVLTSNSVIIGKEFTQNSKVRKLSFTGSTEVGRILIRQSADNILKLGLELGGNAPFIVFDDAHIDDAVEGAIASKYRNNGQTCVCTNRFFIQSNVYDIFAEKLAKKVSALNVGDGFDPDVDVGPLIDLQALNKVKDHISDAITNGGTLLVGGKQHKKGGLFLEPAILTDLTNKMKVFNEETFGPVAPLFKFNTEEEVIGMANDTQYGLASYLYTKDIRKIFRVSEALEYGMVGINTGLISTEVAPFGGIKHSGQGREGSKFGLDEYLEMKYICIDIE